VQLMAFAPTAPKRWVDLGSGGGFPGLVIAAMLAESAPECQTTLIESDLRKATFLREAVRAMQLTTDVIAQRIEKAPEQKADVVSARALAALPALLPLALRHGTAQTTFIFPKGNRVLNEIAEAVDSGWKFDHDLHKSRTDPTGTILTLWNITRERKR
jgi:16S rRNA (guanine527-N7)-methyltransferase